MSIGAWMPLGPAPIDYGQTENVAPKSPTGAYLNEVVGAVQAVVAHPTNPDVLYIGTVNGGIWRTTNATAASPTWTPLTDNAKSLSIGALALDSNDPNGMTLVAGEGRSSASSRTGGTLDGLLYSDDGGATWTPLDGGGTLVGKDCSGITLNGKTIVVSVNNAQTGSYANVGIFRSTDGGKTFSQISNGNGTLHGLPEGITYDLVADPVNPNILYTAVVGADNFGGANGIYKSTNTGSTWTKVSSLALDGYLYSSGTTVTHNVQISVGRSNQVYVGIVNQDSANAGEDKLAAVFRSGNGGGSWTMMDLPKTVNAGVTHGIELDQDPFPAGDPLATLPSGQGSIGFSIVADPNNVNLVYVGGGTQPVVGPTSQIGVTNACGRLFRGDASKITGSQWVHLTDSKTMGPAGGGTASSSSPHADSREMIFDASGRLIEVNDGGVYYRSSPQNNSGDWFSLNGNLAVSEVQNVAYDSISNVALASTQNVGVSEETAAGGTTWNEVSQGYGGDMAVDDVSLASQNESYRYTSTEYLQNFERRTVDANNNVIATTKPKLVVNGTGGNTFGKVDGGQLVTPVALNVVNPSRMIIGGSTSLFESYDGGATLTDLNALGNATAVVYGGYREATPYADVIWAISNSGVYLRINTANPIAQTNYPGGTPRDIAVDSADWEQAYVIDDTRVWYTANAGQTWTNITGNYSAAAGLRTIEFIASGQTGAILVGGTRAFMGRGPTIWATGTSTAPRCRTFRSTISTTMLRTTCWWWEPSAAASGSFRISAPRSSPV